MEHLGRRYQALSWGPRDGPKVLALHGWLDNAASFAVLAPLLPGYHIVAVDLPGHGLSPHRNDCTYHITDYVFDVLCAARGLGWEQFNLLGHSLGAGIATLVAGAFAERVRKLVLIEGLGPLSAPVDAVPIALAQAWKKMAVLASKAPPSYASFDEAVRARARGGSGLREDAARLLCERGLQERDGRWFWRSDARLTLPSAQRLTEAQVLAFLTAITAPVLVVRASAGPEFDEQILKSRAAAVRDLTLRYAQGGHHVHMEKNADEVAREISHHLVS
ncbi:MAG: alpha/beta hydrolase [Gammaproteobacteria bacterium]|nr:alpha/beta hydrolase [Gammaproteobacteria bacterium]